MERYFSLIIWYLKKRMNSKVSFLHISIEGYEMKFTSELFDKRDFLFFPMLYFDSKKPCKIFYASIASEILLFARATTDLINMLKCVNLFWYRRKSKAVNVPVSFLFKKMCIPCSVFVLLYFNNLLEENGDLWKAYLAF